MKKWINGQRAKTMAVAGLTIIFTNFSNNKTKITLRFDGQYILMLVVVNMR